MHISGICPHDAAPVSKAERKLSRERRNEVLTEWIELAAILAMRAFAFSVIGFMFAVPIGIIVLVAHLVWVAI